MMTDIIINHYLLIKRKKGPPRRGKTRGKTRTLVIDLEMTFGMRGDELMMSFIFGRCYALIFKPFFESK
jgi:hypothetical protein